MVGVTPLGIIGAMMHQGIAKERAGWIALFGSTHVSACLVLSCGMVIYPDSITMLLRSMESSAVLKCWDAGLGLKPGQAPLSGLELKVAAWCSEGEQLLPAG